MKGRRFSEAVRRRLVPFLTFFLVLWPLGSAFFAALSIREQSVAAAASAPIVFFGSLFAIGYLASEFLFVALLLIATTLLLFAALDGASGARESKEGIAERLLIWCEPLLFTMAFAAGLALEYPAVLRHSLFRIARNATVFQATAGVFVVLVVAAVTAGIYRGRIRGLIVHLAAFASFIAAGWGIASAPVREKRIAPRGSLVLFGIDSVGYLNDVSVLRRMTESRGGVWYRAAVTPALITNAVWSSILMHRLPQDSGVFLIYQDVDWTRVPFNLVAEAERRGYETWSFFSSQFTPYMASHAGFDHDRSSPIGWLYIATGFVKDSSIFVPVLQPRLPALPFAKSPSNQEGTFAYDLRAAVREALTAGGEKPAFVAAHFAYLHAYGYPRYDDLEPGAVRRLLSARVDTLQDQSLDPELPEIEGDPLSLHDWKIRHIQLVLRDELASTRFLENGNRLVIFSDHGQRRGLGHNTFGRPSAFHVILATFGLPAREPHLPRSLADMASLIGMAPPDQRLPPVVQHFGGILPEEVAVIQNSIQTGKRGSGLKPDGEVRLDPLVVRAIGQRLTTFVPLGPNAGYYPTPVRPAPWTVQ